MDYPAERPRIPIHTGPAAPAARAGLQLVSNALVLGGAADQVPGDWRAPLGELMASAGAELAWAGEPQRGGLRQIRRWAGASGASGAASEAPLFAPWQGWSPAELQAPVGALPQTARGQWLASYVYDCGADRPAHRPVVDVMLASPLAAGCLIDEDCGFALPRVGVLTAMLDAALAEGRTRLAIITHQRAASALARRVLATGRTGSRLACQLDVVAIEDALGPLMAGAPAWDAVIVLPELRSIVLAILAEACALTGPFPLLWHDRGAVRIAAETLRPARPQQPLDAALLVHSLALAARHVGRAELARRLFAGWARLRDNGIASAARGSAAPYATIISEAEFIARIPAAMIAQGRSLPQWQALGPADNQKQGNNCAPAPVTLTLVASR
jgi:hypothetical protein